MMERLVTFLLYRTIKICFGVLMVSGSLFCQERTNIEAKQEKLLTLYNKFNSEYKDFVAKGIPFAEKALTLSKQLDNKFIQAQSLIYIGRYATIQNDERKIRQVLGEALAISKEINNDYLEAKTCLIYGYAFGFVMNKPDSGLIYLKRAYSLSSSINDTTLLKSASARLVWMYKQLNSPANAIRFSQKALAINKNDLKQTASIYNALAIVYGDVGNTKESLKYYELSLQISENLKDELQTASVLNNLATIYASSINLETAIEYYRRALAIYQKHKMPFGVGYTYNCIGMMYASFGKHSYAIEHYQKAVKVFKKIRNKQSLAFALTNLASEYLKAKNYVVTWSYLSEAIAYSEEIGDKLSMIDAYRNAATYFMERNDVDKSIIYLKKAEPLAEEIHNSNFLLGIYDALSECYHVKNDSKRAFYYLHMKDAIADTIRKQSSEKAFAEMIVKYETNKLKEAASKSNTAIENLKTESSKKNLVVGVVILGNVILLSVLFFLFRKKSTLPLKHYASLTNKPFVDKRHIKSALKIIDTETSENVRINSEVTRDIIDKLTLLMEDEKIYLDCNLTLGKVAAKLATNTTYLSHIINKQFEMSFSNYLNKYRIDEAIEIIANHQHDYMSYEGIANSCGFKSRSAFNQAFKRFTGKTPSEFSSIETISNSASTTKD